MCKEIAVGNVNHLRQPVDELSALRTPDQEADARGNLTHVRLSVRAARDLALHYGQCITQYKIEDSLP